MIYIPSRNNFARNKGEAQNPNLWNGLVTMYAPFLSPIWDTIYDLSANRNHAVKSNGTPSCGLSEEFGYQINFASHLNYAAGSRVANFERTDSFSVMAVCTVRNGIECIYSNLPAAGATRGWEMRWSSQKMQYLLIHDGGAGNMINVVSTGTFGPIGNHITAVVTYDGSNSASGVRMYGNGYEPALTVSADALSATCASGETLDVGHRKSILDYNGSFHFGCIWDRKLSAGEGRLLSKDPYRILMPSRNIPLSKSIVATTGTIIPKIMNQYRMRRAA